MSSLQQVAFTSGAHGRPCASGWLTACSMAPHAILVCMSAAWNRISDPVDEQRGLSHRVLSGDAEPYELAVEPCPPSHGYFHRWARP